MFGQNVRGQFSREWHISMQDYKSPIASRAFWDRWVIQTLKTLSYYGPD